MVLQVTLVCIWTTSFPRHRPCKLPPLSYESLANAKTNGPERWDPEGEAMSSLSQNYQAGSAVVPWTAQDDMRWYALHTHARHERVVEHRLREQGMETFLPVVR